MGVSYVLKNFYLKPCQWELILMWIPSGFLHYAAQEGFNFACRILGSFYINKEKNCKNNWSFLLWRNRDFLLPYISWPIYQLFFQILSGRQSKKRQSECTLGKQIKISSLDIEIFWQKLPIHFIFLLKSFQNSSSWFMYKIWYLSLISSVSQERIHNARHCGDVTDQ